MKRAHRKLAKAQQDLPEPTQRLASEGKVRQRAQGRYLLSAGGGDWDERIVVHGLLESVESQMIVADTGVLFTNVGDQGELWIPREQLLATRCEHGLDAKVVGGPSAVVVVWSLGQQSVDTVFHAGSTDTHEKLAAAVRETLSGPARPAPEPLPSIAPAPVEVPELTLSPQPVAAAPVEAPAPPPAAPAPAAEIPVPVFPRTRASRLASLTAQHSAALVTGVRPVAHLLLEDGRSFTGRAWGAQRPTTGEAVFCTGMTGYQETLTDPSYAGQVVVQAAPHIGNTGVNDEDPESVRIWVAGYVVRDPSPIASNWRSTRTLDDELAMQGVVGISDVDTRALVRHLRDNGSMRCAIGPDLDELREAVLAAPRMHGLELASTVSTVRPYVVPAEGKVIARVAALDLGIKGRTPWHLARRGVEVHVLPARTPAAEIMELAPDGVFVSNGPGDPAATTYAHDTVRAVLSARIPFFGICLGNQILGHALGLGTEKLPFGHRGINHPVLDRVTGRVGITSHNHGFAVKAPVDTVIETPYGGVEVSHTSLFDGCVEGLRCKDISAFSVQFHPEAAAGPHDASPLFDEFVSAMTGVRA